MSRRHRARNIILDVLYRLEMDDCGPTEALESYRTEMAEKDITEFVDRMVNNIIAKRPELDDIIDRYADKWSLNRMPLLDRNILRLGIYELEYEDDIPASVTINEAVELANTFSTDDSGRFINGILGHLVRDEEIEKS